MNVKINESIEEKKVKVGDLLTLHSATFGGASYIVADEEKGLILRNLNTYRGANGYHLDMQSLLKNLKIYTEYTHYSQDEYELVLERKQQEG